MKSEWDMLGVVHGFGRTLRSMHVGNGGLTRTEEQMMFPANCEHVQCNSNNIVRGYVPTERCQALA